MRLALDAMGGDDAPRAMVQGAFDYCSAHPEQSVILVGRDADIRAVVAKDFHGVLLSNVVIEHTPEVIGMAEKLKALKERPDDSMNRCAQLMKTKKADAMVLCGNTGCSVGAAQLHLRRIPGVKRAGILVPMPNPKGHTWVCDMGANAECRAEHLAQFAVMTVAFLESVYGKQNPRVGVLSIGEEDDKGVALRWLHWQCGAQDCRRGVRRDRHHFEGGDLRQHAQHRRCSHHAPGIPGPQTPRPLVASRWMSADRRRWRDHHRPRAQ